MADQISIQLCGSSLITKFLWKLNGQARSKLKVKFVNERKERLKDAD